MSELPPSPPGLPHRAAPGRGGERTSARSAFSLAFFIIFSVSAGASWLSTHFDKLLTPEAVASIHATVKPIAPTPAPMRLGVTLPSMPPLYDDMGSILDSLGKGYEYDTIHLRDLADQRSLEHINVLFLCCAIQMARPPSPTQWFGEDLTNPFARFGPYSLLRDRTWARSMGRNLRQFVENGGAIYASDWASSFIAEAFPGRIHFATETLPRQEVNARVLDPGLRTLAGDFLKLRFDMDMWSASDSVFNGTTYLESDIDLMDGSKSTKGLLVSFPVGKGQVIFTSFHNEKQLSESERALLKYLVLKPIVTRAAQSAREHLVSQNLTLSQESLFSTGSGRPSFAYMAKEGQDLAFVLSWNVQGEDSTDLVLVVTGPDGHVLRQQGQSPPLTVNVPRAQGGAWHYEVEAIRVPYREFPYVVSVGAKDR